MDNTTNEIYFNFSYFALRLLGKQMYTNQWSAISELVANGLDAGASNVKVYINAIDKKKSTIEIIDNGSGMSYEDLVSKYALIGRNKREMEQVDEDIKGRKGVGKLAALYLSKKYYIVTKSRGEESSWVLDSNNVLDSDLPSLKKVSKDKLILDNQEKWDELANGTLLRLVDVDMSYFGEKKLEGLKNNIADYYLLDKINGHIEVAYVTTKKEKENITYYPVEKKVAFKNFYAFIESTDSSKINELSKEVYIQSSGIEEIDRKKREVIVYNKDEVQTIVETFGKAVFKDEDGKDIEKKYMLNGWIGIHATINKNEAEDNDVNFVRNGAYNPNRIKLYTRGKLAMSNFFEYLENTQAFGNYIEGEISFDILDDNDLPDISTTNREGISKDDDRVQLLIYILKKIVNKLIRERVVISGEIKDEAHEYNEKLRQEEREKRIAEEQARKVAEEEQIIMEEKVNNLVTEKLTLETQNKELETEKMSLETQNEMKDIVLSDSDPEKQTLLVHELTGIGNTIDYVIEDMSIDFMNTKEYKRIQNYVKDLKKGSSKLATIRRQFLKLNNYNIIGKQDIDLRMYLKSYFQTISTHRTNIKISIGEEKYLAKVEIFELGVLLDNIIINAQEKEATYIEVVFEDEMNEIHIISDTGPIDIVPLNNIFKLGVSSKKNGTGIGMYLCDEIAKKHSWDLSVENKDEIVKFILKLEG